MQDGQEKHLRQVPGEDVRHPKVGHLWVRRTKTGKTFLAGYVWVGNGVGRRKKYYTIKVKVNHAKGTPNDPDYVILDYSKEVNDALRKSFHDSYCRAAIEIKHKQG